MSTQRPCTMCARCCGASPCYIPARYEQFLRHTCCDIGVRFSRKWELCVTNWPIESLAVSDPNRAPPTDTALRSFTYRPRVRRGRCAFLTDANECRFFYHLEGPKKGEPRDLTLARRLINAEKGCMFRPPVVRRHTRN